MKDEIKEIKISGNQLQIGNTVYQLDYKVLDYITNLQENKMYAQLKEEYEDIIDKASEIIDEALFIGVKDYRSQLEIVQNILEGKNND